MRAQARTAAMRWSVCSDSAAVREPAAAAARASMRRPCSCVHHQTTGGVRPNARENDQISPSIAVRTARGEGSRPRHPPVLPERGKSAKIHAGSGFIWRISAYMSLILSVPQLPGDYSGHPLVFAVLWTILLASGGTAFGNRKFSGRQKNVFSFSVMTKG
jgi:hypothetical protein